MPILPTVRIFNDAGDDYIVINAVDFDPAKHVLFEDAAPVAAEPRDVAVTAADIAATAERLSDVLTPGAGSEPALVEGMPAEIEAGAIQAPQPPSDAQRRTWRRGGNRG